MFLKTDGAGNLSFDSLSFATPLAVIGNATAGSEIRLPEDTDNGSNYVAIKAPDTLASNLTLTLPSADGTSGQVLQTNGSGVLSFAGVSASAGQVIQVVSATSTTASTITSTSFVSLGFSASITPSSTSNKILVIVNFTVENTAVSAFNIDRAGTLMSSETNGLGSIQTANLNVMTSLNYLDSPSSTSSTTYTLFGRTTGTLYFDPSAHKASMVLLEIKG